MARRACDGPGLLEAFRAAVANLETHVDEINSLNVYPVPDGDTGSNMFATVRAALDEADTLDVVTVERVRSRIRPLTSRSLATPSIGRPTGSAPV